MGRLYFKKKGFVGLTVKGKLIDSAIFLGVGFVAWFVFNAGTDNIFGIVKAIALALLVAWIVQFFLPRDDYYYTEYFCADCGQFLGYSPMECDRCGCNRYTSEDPGVGMTIKNR